MWWQGEVERTLVEGDREACHGVFLFLQERIRLEGFLAEDQTRGGGGGEMSERNMAGHRTRPRSVLLRVGEKRGGNSR